MNYTGPVHLFLLDSFEIIHGLEQDVLGLDMDRYSFFWVGTEPCFGTVGPVRKWHSLDIFSPGPF